MTRIRWNYYCCVMSPVTRYFAWMYFRALVWIILCSLFLRLSTRNWKVVRAFFGAHLAALGFAIVTDIFLFAYAPPRLLPALRKLFRSPSVRVEALADGTGKKNVCVPDPPVKVNTSFPPEGYGLVEPPCVMVMSAGSSSQVPGRSEEPEAVTRILATSR